MIPTLIVYHLLVLHTPDGAEIAIVPSEIVMLRSRAADDDKTNTKLFSDKVHCLINTSDGKFVSIIETCEDVRRQMEAE